MLSFTIFLMSAAGIIISYSILGEKRPSLWGAAARVLVALLGLGHPIVFEDATGPGCGSVVTAQPPDGQLERHEHLAWCPDACVNVPKSINIDIILPNQNRFTAHFPVRDPVAAVRAFKLLSADTVVSNDATTEAIRKLATPHLLAFSDEHKNDLLARNFCTQEGLDRTGQEFAQYLDQHPAVLLSFREHGIAFTGITSLERC